jgi:ELWxxDGT repeat protein
MEEKLLSKSISDCWKTRKMYRCLYILFITICGAAYSQPTMLSAIPNTSKNFVLINGSLYYSSADGLYKATSTSTPVLVKATGQPILKIYSAVINSTFFFVTQNGSGQSLWRSDGTAANTVQITTQTEIIPILVYHSNLFLRINTPETGKELWKMDASYNVTLVKDIDPGSASGFFGDLVINNDRLYLLGYSGPSQDLWQSDGTTSGTAISVDLPYTGFTELTVVNTTMFFTRSYSDPENPDENKIAELWKSDGTSAGTFLVKQFPSDYTYNSLYYLTAFKGKLYFIHTTGYPPFDYLWVSDGTEAGTQLIENVSGDGYVPALINADDTYLLYYGNSQGFLQPITKFDGTTSSTVHNWSYMHNDSEDHIDLTYADGRAFFIDDSDSENGGGSATAELWQADLAAGTDDSMQNLYGTPMSNSGNIAASGSNIFFTRLINGNMSLWYYDPNAPASSCAGLGTIQLEKWNNVSGYSISSIPVNTEPSSVTNLYKFDAPQDTGDNYGARIRGYVCVPLDGNYVFYISSDDNSELWLSTDDNPANKKLIASSKWTNYDEWTKYPTQQSAEIPLVKGNKYYIEALHKEASGADHFSVGWRLPNGTLERPIQGNRLVPFKRGVPPTVTITQPANGANFSAPATIDIAATAQDNDGTVTKVEFYQSGKLLEEDRTAPYTYSWQYVPAGNYTIEAKATDNEGNTKSAFSSITVSPSCSGTGNILEDIWYNAPGVDVRTFNFTTAPNGGTHYLNEFATPQYFADNYARRIRGWICVPQSGSYTFWISSDDYSELYLSTDESEANKKLIAWVYGAAKYGVYDKYPSQKSALITLKAGYRYYVEARHKEGTGNDFVSVGWQLPDGTIERPISGNRLLPSTTNTGPSITIKSPTPNQTFAAPASVKIAADITDPDGVQVVYFDAIMNDGSNERLATFTSPPYEYQWNGLSSGSYRLIVSASDRWDMAAAKSVDFTVGSAACTGTGTIVREIWTGISGTSVSSIPVNSPPNAKVTLNRFATPNYYGNDYGSRIRGYLCVPASGAYKFYISSDDNSELWLSDNDDPSTKKRIAYVTGATAVNQWDKYSSQTSGYINLVQGQRYYVEVLHKEGGGADHVEVGWLLPQGTLERPIPGNRLIPFNDPSASATAFSPTMEFHPEGSEKVSVYPNPVVSGNQLTISIPGEITGDVAVDISSLAGMSIQNENVSNASNEVVIDLKPSISPGIYLVTVRDNKRRWLNKVQIK